MKYHTAIKSKHKPAEGVIYNGDFHSNKITAIKHNIENGYLSDFDKCDILYSEPAWRMGYKVFMERADEEASSYVNYVKNICGFISSSGKKCILIIGKADLKTYQKFIGGEIKTIILTFHNCDALAMYINMDALDLKSDLEIKEYMSLNYNCVGDFCCGYGDVIPYFLDKNKSVVVSDINENCIAYIIQTFNK